MSNPENPHSANPTKTANPTGSAETAKAAHAADIPAASQNPDSPQARIDALATRFHNDGKGLICCGILAFGALALKMFSMILIGTPDEIPEFILSLLNGFSFAFSITAALAGTTATALLLDDINRLMLLLREIVDPGDNPAAFSDNAPDSDLASSTGGGVAHLSTGKSPFPEGDLTWSWRLP